MTTQTDWRVGVRLEMQGCMCVNRLLGMSPSEFSLILNTRVSVVVLVTGDWILRRVGWRRPPYITVCTYNKTAQFATSTLVVSDTERQLSVVTRSYCSMSMIGAVHETREHSRH